MRIELQKPDGSKLGPFEVKWPEPVTFGEISDWQDIVARKDRDGVAVEGRVKGAEENSSRIRIVLLNQIKPTFGLLDTSQLQKSGDRKLFIFRLVD